jgi:hypothetical protein
MSESEYPDARRDDVQAAPFDEQVRVDVDGDWKRDLKAAVEESEYYSVAAAVRGELDAFIEETEVRD